MIESRQGIARMLKNREKRKREQAVTAYLEWYRDLNEKILEDIALRGELRYPDLARGRLHRWFDRLRKNL